MRERGKEKGENRERCGEKELVGVVLGVAVSVVSLHVCGCWCLLLLQVCE